MAKDKPEVHEFIRYDSDRIGILVTGKYVRLEDYEKIAAELKEWRDTFAALVDAHIHESPRPDCDPAYRFRAMTCKHTAWFATREEAGGAILTAAKIGGDR